MPRYRITNRATKETAEVEAPYAQDACDWLEWPMGHCYVELLRDGPYTNIGAPVLRVIKSDASSDS